jgi:rhodanese-related sulfurtransferase
MNPMKKMFTVAAMVTTVGVMGGVVNAQANEVKIAADLPYVEFTVSGETVKVERIQDQNNVLRGGYTKTSRKCPPFCVQPMHLADGVTTVAELEVLDFMKTKVAAGKGVLIDARTPSWHEKGTIPGSVNIPFTDFGSEDQAVVDKAMWKLGARKKVNPSFVSNLIDKVTGNGNDKWDFSEARDILLWCNGMWCGQSPAAIKNILAQGYPAEKIFWYRGGMQSWQSLGLTVVTPTL